MPYPEFRPLSRPPVSRAGRGSRLALLLAVSFTSILAARPAAAAFYWVGNGGISPCTHATLQAAIATAQTNATNDVIFIVGNVTLPGDLTILPGGGLDLQITGGVPSCGVLANPTTVSTIAAGPGQRAFTIAAGPGEIVTLWNLIITNGNGTVNGNGGAILFSGATSTLRLVDTVVRDSNCLGNGGGLHVNSGTVELQGTTRFHGNSANNGGAIAISGSSGFIKLQGVVVEGNTAFTDGGGIYAPRGTVEFLGAAPSVPVAVLDNLAGNHGGGFFYGAESHGGFGFTTVPTAPIEIAANRANRGAGAYVSSTVGIAFGNAALELNEAFAEGGGLYVAAGGNAGGAMPLGPGNGLPLFAGNEAPDGQAIFASDAMVGFYAGTVLDHPGAASAALFAAEGESTVRLNGMTIHHNAVGHLAALEDDSVVLVEYSTVAENVFATSLLRQAGATTVVLTNSVFAETEPIYAAPAPSSPLSTVFDCVVSRYPSMLQGLPAGTDTSTLLHADPLLADPVGGDFHLTPFSPAIDRCPVNAVWLPDGDGDDRGIDEGSVPNPAGRTFDAGADEGVFILFADGFETGDTSRWSSSAP